MGQPPSLFLLGPPRLEWQGQPVGLDRHKALALLAYLAVSDQPHRRDALAAIFWPESGPDQARAALRRALATLTRALPGDWWQIERETLGLRCGPVAPNGVWLDVRQSQTLLATWRGHGHSQTQVCAACLPPLAEAVALHRGDFLAGFNLRDSPDFDDWQLLQAESLRRELAGALERLSRGHAAHREWETAIGYARRWLALDPLEEAAHRRLMELYAWAGQPHAALRQYDECVRRLDRELGVTPADDTHALAQSVRQGQVLPTPPDAYFHRSLQAAAHSPTPRSIAPPPALFPLSLLASKRLVGRDAEVARAAHLWAQAIAGQAQTLLVTGEVGVGKSRLLREIIALAQADGALVLGGECYAEAAAPYAAIAQWLAGALAGPAPPQLALPGYVLADLLTLAPELRARWPDVAPNPPLDGLAEQQRLFDSVAAFYAALSQATGRPLLAHVEDIHWADAGALALLLHLARRSRRLGLRLLLILTLRDAETPLAGEQALAEMVLALNRERLAESLHLARLDRGQTQELLGGLLSTGGAVSDEFLSAIYAETEGNPFFVEEVCKALASAGQLFYAGGRWQRLEMAELLIPDSVRAAILSRVSHLPAADQEILRMAAILGREFAVADLLAASQVDGEAVAAALERAERAHLIHEERRPSTLRCRFVHALIPLALRQSLSGLRRRRLHARAAAIIADLRPADVEALAYHSAAAGLGAQAIAYARQAAARARTMYAHESALAHLRLALDLLAETDDPPARLTVLEEMADLRTLQGEGVAGVTLYQEALALWRTQPEGDLWQGVRLLRKIGDAVTHLSQFTDYERLAAVSRESLLAGLRLVTDQTPHPETARLLTALARDAWYTGLEVDWEAVEGYAHAGLEMAQALDAPLEMAAALEALAVVYGVRGELRQRLAVVQRRLELSRGPRFADPRQRAGILFQTGYSLSDVGEYNQAVAHLRAAEELARQIHDLALLCDVWAQLGECYLRLDRWDELLELEDNLHDLLHQQPVERLGVMVCFLIACSASVRARRGDGAGAAARRREAQAMMTAIAGPESRWGRNQHF